ncbi:MAG: hypothetical protein ACYCWC_07210, partial [Rhodocyclaceae bacterium]
RANDSGLPPAKVGQHQTIPTKKRPALNNAGRFCFAGQDIFISTKPDASPESERRPRGILK